MHRKAPARASCAHLVFAAAARAPHLKREGLLQRTSLIHLAPLLMPTSPARLRYQGAVLHNKPQLPCPPYLCCSIALRHLPRSSPRRCHCIQAPAIMLSPYLRCCTVALPVKVQPQLLKRYCPVQVRYGGLRCKPYRLVVIVHRIISSTLHSSDTSITSSSDRSIRHKASNSIQHRHQTGRRGGEECCSVQGNSDN